MKTGDRREVFQISWDSESRSLPVFRGNVGALRRKSKNLARRKRDIQHRIPDMRYQRSKQPGNVPSVPGFSHCSSTNGIMSMG